MVRIGIVGDLDAGNERHRATEAALQHAARRLEVQVAATWLDTDEARVIELPGHPFFVGTLFVPQARSTAENPHPLLVALVRAAV